MALESTRGPYTVSKLHELWPTNRTRVLPTLRKFCILLHCHGSQTNVSKRNSTKFCDILHSGLCCRQSVCLSSVVGAPYSGSWTCRQYFFTAVYASHSVTSLQNFTEIVPGNTSIRGVKRKIWTCSPNDIYRCNPNVVTPKRHLLARKRRLGHKAWKSVQRFDLGAGSRKKVRTWQDRTVKSHKGVIFHLFGEKPPLNRFSQNFTQ